MKHLFISLVHRGEIEAGLVWKMQVMIACDLVLLCWIAFIWRNINV